MPEEERQRHAPGAPHDEDGPEDNGIDELRAETASLLEAAGAAIEDHLHWHLVPRWMGDSNFMAVIGDCDVVPESLTATAKLVKENW